MTACWQPSKIATKTATAPKIWVMVSYMITKRTGGHVHLGRLCRQVLTQFLLQRILPGQREFLCPGYFLEDRYTPRAKAKASDNGSPLALVEAVIHEIENVI